MHTTRETILAALHTRLSALAVTALRGVPVLPPARRFVPRAVRAERAAAWLAAATITGVTVGLVTGWPVAGLATGVGLLVGPAALGGEAQRRAETATAEAIATSTGLVEPIIINPPLVPDLSSIETAPLPASARG